MNLLDNVPVATIVSILGIIGAIIALCNGSMDFDEFSKAVGAIVGGSGLLGLARAASGKGLAK